jgi:chemotaxis signal transduction protein
MDDETKRYMVFERGGRTCAVPADRVSEVAVNLHVTPVPLTGAAVKGLVPIHGHPVALVDLATWFSESPSLPIADEIVAQMIVLHIDVPGSVSAIRFAIIVDRVIGYRSLPPAAASPLPPQPSFVIGSASVETPLDRNPVTLIDPNRLFETTLALMPDYPLMSTGT